MANNSNLNSKRPSLYDNADCSRAQYTHCDVSSWQSLSALFKSVFERHGHIDIVVANAGIVERKEFLDDEVTETGELKEPDLSVLNVNLVGCMFTGKLALWWFKKNPTPGGALVMISSVGGYADGTSSSSLLISGKGITLYKASKHGVSSTRIIVKV